MRVLWYAYLVIILLLTSCKTRYEETLVQLKLTDNWEFRNISESQWHKAEVPGDVISEYTKIKGWGNRWFLKSGQLREILGTTWEYRNIFEVSRKLLSKDSINILFPGVRESARVYINNTLVSGVVSDIGTSLSCKQLLKEGKNELRIVFDTSAVNRLTEEKDHDNQCLIRTTFSPLVGDLDNLPFKNAADIPGLIESPCLTAWSNAKIEDVYFYPLTISDKTAQYNAEINIMASKETEVNLEISVDDKCVIKLNELKLKPGSNRQIVSFTIANPKLWWTNGLGQQHLYNVTFRLFSSRQLAHELTYPLGARKLEVIYDSDSINKPPSLLLNGNSIFLKGGIVDIPRNLNPSEINVVYQQIVENAKAANINIIRLLNSRFYQFDLFYRLCSENGILIWQDFSVSDVSYISGKDKFNYVVEQRVKYLRNMPCCAVYMGKDESCNNKSKIAAKPDGFIVKELLLTIKKYDNRTFCWPCYSGKEKYETPDIDAKSMFLCVAQGIIPPSFTSSSSIINLAGNLGFSTTEIRSEIYSNSYLDTALSKNPYLASHVQQISKSYPDPVNLASAFYMSQLYQASQIKNYIESQRLKSDNMFGFTHTEIYDSYPSSSGNSIDFLGQAKPAYFTLRDSYASNILIAQTDGLFVNVYAINDDLKDLDAILLCKMIDFLGNTYFVKQVPVRIKANSKALLLTLNKNELLSTLSPNKVALLLQINQPGRTNAQNIFYFAEPKLLELPQANIKVDINQSNHRYNVILKSNVFVKNLWMEADRVDTRFSDNNIDIIPGKRYKISVFYRGSHDELAKNLVIKSLNNFR